jgi:O-antigen ligase
MALVRPPNSPLPAALEASREVSLQPRRVTDTYRLALSLIFVLLAATVDVPNFLDRGNFLRYLLLLVPIGTVALVRLRAPSSVLRAPGGSDLWLLLLWMFGLGGTIYAIWLRGMSATALSVFLPMTIAFLYMGMLETLTEREIDFILRALAAVGSLYICLAALVNAGLTPALAATNQYKNAGLLFVALGIAATIILRRWGRALVLIGLEAFAFAAYPSGTTVLVTIMILLTFSMTQPRPTKVRPYVIATLIASMLVLILLNFGTGVAVTNEYFSLVGKNDANNTRLEAWTSGIERFKQSPLIGSGFTEPGLVQVSRPRGLGTFQIPYHNDYIFFLAQGGVVGFGLLVAWIVATELTVLRRYRELLLAGEARRSALLRVLLVAFNVFLVAAAFNPTVEGMSRSASVFALYALMMAIRPPTRSWQAE